MLDVVLRKNSTAVIKWFQSIEAKDNCTFTNFDFIEFYPSISENLGRALSFAREYINISDEEINVIQHSRKLLLVSLKKDGTGLFDVEMGSYMYEKGWYWIV